jgi:hypothetical protein
MAQPPKYAFEYEYDATKVDKWTFPSRQNSLQMKSPTLSRLALESAVRVSCRLGTAVPTLNA